MDDDEAPHTYDASSPSALLRGVNVAAFVLCLASNGWAGGKIGRVARKYPNEIGPDGWTFSIWGIIYALLCGFVV